MPEDGALTLPVAMHLKKHLSAFGDLRVFFDHAGDGRQTAYGYIGKEGPRRGSQLAQVDILVGDARTGRALLVIEIEETGATPKKLLGDVFAFALCDMVGSSKERFAITPDTRLLVCFPAHPAGNKRQRDEALLERVRRTLDGTPNPRPVEFVVSECRDALAQDVIERLEGWIAERSG